MAFATETDPATYRSMGPHRVSGLMLYAAWRTSTPHQKEPLDGGWSRTERNGACPS
jgi:hypothetical protein